MAWRQDAICKLGRSDGLQKCDCANCAGRAWEQGLLPLPARPLPCGFPRLEEPVARARQAEILAQGLALVVAAEDAAPLQLWHHLVDKVVEPSRQKRKHDVESVRTLFGEPLL